MRTVEPSPILGVVLSSILVESVKLNPELDIRSILADNLSTILVDRIHERNERDMTMTETHRATAMLSATTAATLGRCLTYASKIASSDLARGPLAGVRISATLNPDGEQSSLTFQATDSYRLIHVNIPLSADDVVPMFDPFVVEAKQAAKVGKLITKKNVNNGVGFTVTGPMFTLTTADGSGNAELLFGHWPDTERLLNPENTGELPRVDADLLASLLSAMSSVMTDHKVVAARVEFDSVGGSTKPMRLSGTVDACSVVGLLMPVKK